MAKPNYAFEKRQRELAKKKKQDAKQARKREARDAAPPQGAQSDAQSRPESGTPATPAATVGAPERAEAQRGTRVHRRPSSS